MTNGSSRRRFRIGELAAATGLTVRTLHHYEHVGLLTPAARTEGQQRLYDEDDLRRLYRIAALRDLGFSLAEIGRALDDERGELVRLLHAHRAHVDEEIARLSRLRALLDHAASYGDREVDTESLLATLVAMSKVARRTEVIREAQRDGSPEIETDDAREARWRALGDALRACMDAGEPASGPRARGIARALRAHIEEFAGGDGATLEALAHLRRAAPPEDLAGFCPALMRYLDEALAHLDETEDEGC